MFRILLFCLNLRTWMSQEISYSESIHQTGSDNGHHSWIRSWLPNYNFSHSRQIASLSRVSHENTWFVCAFRLTLTLLLELHKLTVWVSSTFSTLCLATSTSSFFGAQRKALTCASKYRKYRKPSGEMGFLRKLQETLFSHLHTHLCTPYSHFFTLQATLFSLHLNNFLVSQSMVGENGRGQEVKCLLLPR